MYHRILTARAKWWDALGYAHPYHDLMSDDLRETLSRHKTFDEARSELERLIKLERLSCPTGGCED